MFTRYMGMTVKSQSYLFSLGFILTVLGMMLTDMWLPMVVGALVLMGLMVEAWIRFIHLIPMHQELRILHQQVAQLQEKKRQQNDTD